MSGTRRIASDANRRTDTRRRAKKFLDARVPVTQKARRGGNLRCRIDNILRNHSGIGLKILRLHLDSVYCCFPYIDNWLQVAVTPGIEELPLRLHEKYEFPCSLLSAGVRSSIRSLLLDLCVFHPTLELGPLRSLTRLTLRDVRITGEELECLLSNSLALEHLDFITCKEIIFLKIPSALLQLSYLRVCGCWDLQVIENKAPRVSPLLPLSGKFQNSHLEKHRK